MDQHVLLLKNRFHNLNDPYQYNLLYEMTYLIFLFVFIFFVKESSICVAIEKKRRMIFIHERIITGVTTIFCSQVTRFDFDKELVEKYSKMNTIDII
jgi:hypothetical protein